MNHQELLLQTKQLVIALLPYKNISNENTCLYK
jgi:hypothetical protein